MLTESGKAATFCTVACGLLEPGQGSARVTLASGGHPLPFVLRADGSFEPTAVPGTLLGFFDDPTLVDSEVELRSGDVLVLYTDGVISRRRGVDELEAIVRGTAGLDAASIAERIERAALAGDARRDDVAILVLKLR
jgi:serine phosphatase RsbU (regulator of sigma subunit)